MKILLNRKFRDEQVKKLEELGYEVLYIHEQELKNRDDFYDVDVWFTYYGFNEVDLDRFTNLKYILLTSTGIDQVPIEFVKNNKILLSNNTSGYSVPIAESVIMYILEVYKNSYQAFERQKNHLWKMDLSWKELSGSRVGFLGTGTIAKEAAKRLKAFDVEILGVNTSGRDVEFFDKCYPLTNSDYFFETCDIIVGILPQTSDTNYVLTPERLDLMKDGSTLINVGRGNLVDLKELEKRMDKFRGVVLDVVEEEPLDEDSPLWNKKNIILTAHNSWVSVKNKDRWFDYIYENLKSYIETGKPKKIVENIKRGY